jgi:predicted DNA-binding antitoxin AbrB/MazE fold protein
MEIQVGAMYENGVLKPSQPLGLAEHGHVSVTVIKAVPAPSSPRLDIAYLETLKAYLLHAGPAPGIEEVRRRLSKIPSSMTGISSLSARIGRLVGLLFRQGFNFA